MLIHVTGARDKIAVQPVMSTSRPSRLHLQMVEVMKRFPEGIAAGQIRQELGLPPEEQTHLERRRRDLKKWFVIEKIEFGENGKRLRTPLYKYVRDRAVVTDEGDVSNKLKAAVRYAAHGRCQICGRTISEDGIKLVVDHKNPRAWGGTNDRENLQAICEECNAGKKAHFATFDADLMKRVINHESVHVRIGELLKAKGVGERTTPDLLEVAAGQEDWRKRLRELRYEVIGWKIDFSRYKTPSGVWKADYVLKEWKPWPEDPSGLIRRFERERGAKNKAER